MTPESSGFGSLAGLPLFEDSPPASPIQLRFGTTATPAVPSTVPAAQLTTARRAVQDTPAHPASDDLDWALVREMRAKAADALADAQLAAVKAGLAFDERQAGADIVADLLQEHATNLLHTG